MARKSGFLTSLLSGRDRQKTLFWAIVAMVVLFVMSAFLAGNTSLFKLYQLYQQRNELRERRDLLKSEKEALEEEVKLLESDPEYIEKVAREKYNLKKEDEEVYKAAPE